LSHISARSPLRTRPAKEQYGARTVPETGTGFLRLSQERHGHPLQAQCYHLICCPLPLFTRHHHPPLPRTSRVTCFLFPKFALAYPRSPRAQRRDPSSVIEPRAKRSSATRKRSSASPLALEISKVAARSLLQMLVFDAFKSRDNSPTEHYSRTLKDRISSLAHPTSMPEPRRRR